MYEDERHTQRIQGATGRNVFERDGNVWMWNLADERYMKLSEETAKFYLKNKGEVQEHLRQKNCPRLKAEWKTKNDAFWREFDIAFKVHALIAGMRKAKDSRLDEILSLRQEIRRSGQVRGDIDFEIKAGNAVLDYVEGKYPELYGYLQRYSTK